MYHLLQGELLFDSKNSDQSLLELDSANQISIENEFNVYLTDIYSKQIEIYTNQEKWQQAVDKYEKYVKLKSELNSIKVKNQLEDLTFQNELNKKELEIELIQEERDLANKNVKFVKKIGDYENRIVWFLVSSFVFILGLIVFGIRRITKNK